MFIKTGCGSFATASDTKSSYRNPILIDILSIVTQMHQPNLLYLRDFFHLLFDVVRSHKNYAIVFNAWIRNAENVRVQALQLFAICIKSWLPKGN